ncbi:MAG: DUF2203 domain-containing protein [Gemmatimonadetes bacterium]|nr:DUF2203 domain-containing protein [Gemmatimonadota bacterium]
MSGPTDLRIFTIEEANRALPDLRQRLPELRKLLRKIERAEDRLDILDLICNRSVSASNPDLREYLSLKAKYHRLIERFEERLSDLDAVGYLLMNLEDGVVHFVARRRGQNVLLCWKEGESEVGHWHEPHDGTADEGDRRDIGTPWKEH